MNPEKGEGFRVVGFRDLGVLLPGSIPFLQGRQLGTSQLGIQT